MLFGERTMGREAVRFTVATGKTLVPSGPSINPPVWVLVGKVARKVAAIRTPADVATVPGPAEPIARPKPGLRGVVVGDRHACGWTGEGQAVCWGSNRFWQQGRALRSGPCAPLELPGLEGVSTMAAVADYTCAIDGDRAITCWGQHPARQIDEQIELRVTVPLGAPAVELAVASDYACARTLDRQVWCWGEGVAVGPEGGPGRVVPRLVPGLSGAIAIAAGESLACAAVEGRAVHCWGAIAELLTDPPEGVRQFDPKPLAGLVDAAAVTIFGDIVCALDRSGRTWCWAKWGELGSRLAPVPQRMSGSSAVALRGSTRPRRSCALVAKAQGGHPHCWHFDQDPTEPAPADQVLGLSLIRDSVAVTDLALATGPRAHQDAFMGCLLRDDQRVMCWRRGGSLWSAELESLHDQRWETELSAACQGLDTDGDGRFDADDRCPDEAEVYNTYADDDGCPDEPASLVRLDESRRRIELLARVEFEGRDTLRPSSTTVLEHLAALIRAHPQLSRIEIQAHRDSHTGPIYGMRPTQRQARRVRDFLVERGVDPSRLIAKGFGEDMPIDTNRTPEGRARNRRIEVVIREWAD